MHVLLVDGDNVNPERIDDILSDIQERGELKTFRIYADFSRPAAAAWKRVVESRPVEAIQVYSSRPQAVDLTMSLDGAQCIFEEGPCTLCIASGDRDFTHLMRKAHQKNCRVIAYATNSHVSPQLKSYCDEFIHMCQSPAASKKATPRDDTQSKDAEKIKRIVNRILEQPPPVHPTPVYSELLRHNPAYNYKNFGYNSFKRWMFALGYEVTANSMCAIK